MFGHSKVYTLRTQLLPIMLQTHLPFPCFVFNFSFHVILNLFLFKDFVIAECKLRLDPFQKLDNM